MQTALPQSGPRRNGPDRLIETAGASVDRMPMLRVVLERTAAHCATELQRLTSTPMELELRQVSVGRTGDILDSYGGEIVAAALDAPEWNAKLLVGLDRPCLFALVETLFGGDGGEPPQLPERPFSNVETRLAQALFEIVASSLQTCFTSIAPAAFKFERILAPREFSVVGKPNSVGIAAKITLAAIERGGEMLILIPQTALSPARPNLTREPSEPAPVERDPNWSKQFEAEVGRAAVTLQAVIKGKELTLGDVADFKVGQILTLETPTRERVRLACDGRNLFWCQLGQSAGFYTLRIEHPVDQEQEFFDDILPR
jgi:flagellar motor switch protein FliM